MSLLAERSLPPLETSRPAIPNGWQSIGFADEIAAGQVVSRHVLGRDLVLFRGHSGRLSVLDAYCPHLGAHLGGGDVVDDCVRCPYHHWQFAGDGRCRHVPYGTRIPSAAVVGSYAVREINGFVFVWLHSGGASPDWEIPHHAATEDARYRLFEKREHLFRGHPQDISENGADFAHFIAIHGWDGVKLKFEPDGCSYRVGYDTDGVDTGYGDAGAVDVDSLAVGPGYTYTHYTGVHDWLMISCFTVADPGVVYLHQRYYARDDLDDATMRQLVDAVDNEWRKDIRIWEAKVYRDRPPLNDGDGPIAQFRRWYAQFY